MKLYLEGNTSEVLTNMGKKVLKQYLEALAAMSSALSKQLGKYDMYSMIAGMVFVFQVSRALLFYYFLIGRFYIIQDSKEQLSSDILYINT